MPDVPPDVGFRHALEERAREEGWQALQLELERVDPVSAARIDPKNVRRVIRALEVFHATGTPFSAWQRERSALTAPSRSPESVGSAESPGSAVPSACRLVGLALDRPELYARIDRRIDAWMAAGFVDEVRGLLARGYAPELPSMTGIGYREVATFLRGQLSLEDAIAQIKHATHQYAKRQMTWFRRDARIHWLDAAAATASDVVALLPPEVRNP
jgi:tRNA dimethylallyltransferase